MKDTQSSDSMSKKFLQVSGNARSEDWREILGIMLSLLVIAAFLVMAFTMSVPMVKDADDLVTSIFR